MPTYIAFHKPYGVLSQFTSTDGARTLAEFGFPTGIYAAGRLDKDSEGLLLLTDDGPFKSRLLDPASGHRKVYWAQVEGMITTTALRSLREGVVIQNQLTRPCQARHFAPPPIPPRNPPIRERKNQPTSWVELELTEGKNRQVRRMTAKVGFPTLRLLRMRIENLSLIGLAPGQWRRIQKAEIM